jgi:starvation-inducible DNA-binding protein
MTTDTLDRKIIENNTRKKIYSRLGYTKMETAEIVDALNKLLANYNVHYQKLRNYHWNVKGPDFFDIHEKFETQYNFAREAIDQIAERIRVFGQVPISTMKGYLETSEIKESGTDLTGVQMMKQILKDFEILLEHMFNVIDIALENGDSGTEDMIKSFVKHTEKSHWMYTHSVKRVKPEVYLNCPEGFRVANHKI